MRTILLLLVSLAFILPAEGQISTREIREKTKEGSELLTKGKFDEAIGIFTDILRSDPTQGKALLLRARAKYEVGAYKGVMNDCFAYMEKYGIDDEVSGLLGKTESALGHYKQALSYLKVALFLNPDGVEYLLDRAQIFSDLGLEDDACADWTRASENGSSTARSKMKRYCHQVRVPVENKPKDTPKKEKPVDVVDTNNGEEQDTEIKRDVPVNTGSTTSENDQNNTETSSNTGSNSGSTTDHDSGHEYDDDVILDDDNSYEDDYPVDYYLNEIYIDSELSIEIGNGIGSRKVVEIPDMLILSDKSGVVVVDVCLNEIGEVIYYQLNEELSTIKTKGLVSLALRKSEQFWFERINRAEHCGTISFIITAG